MTKHDEARDWVYEQTNGSRRDLRKYINEYEQLEKDVQELMRLIVGNYDMEKLEDDMKILDGDDARIVELIIKLLKIGEEK
jgi:hypothetical protein